MLCHIFLSVRSKISEGSIFGRVIERTFFAAKTQVCSMICALNFLHILVEPSATMETDMKRSRFSEEQIITIQKEQRERLADKRSDHKKPLRLYREEKLQVRKRGGRKRALGTRRPMVLPSRFNERWSLDFFRDDIGQLYGSHCFLISINVISPKFNIRGLENVSAIHRLAQLSSTKLPSFYALCGLAALVFDRR